MKLSKNAINMIKGIANYYAEHYQRAISYLEKCSSNAYANYLVAMSYFRLREYEKAAEYAQLSAEKGYTKAYHFASHVLTGNLEQYDKAYAFLQRGIKKHSAHACIAMLSFYLNKGAFLQADPYLDEYENVLAKAWRYAKNDEKCYVSNNITYIYRALRHRYGDYDNGISRQIAKELKANELKFALIANEYGNGIRPEYNNADLADMLDGETSNKDKRAILNSLYDHFDSTSALLFGLLLIKNSRKKVSVADEPWMFFAYGTQKGSIPCALMYGLLYGSHLPKSTFDAASIKDLFEHINPNAIYIVPSIVQDTFLSLLDSYDKQFESEINELKRRMYAPK